MSRRVPILVILLGLVLGGFVVDRTTNGDTELQTAPPTVDSSVFPVAAAPEALSSTWFCAGGTADEEAFADHVVVIANPTADDVVATLTAFAGVIVPAAARADTGEATTTTAETTTTVAPPVPEPVELTVPIPARSRKQVALHDLVDAPVASALVEASPGGVVVEHQVTSINGFDAKPCATSAASRWNFAFGETTVDARELLVLFNPFPDDAIVDGRFSTEDGIREPERFDGLVVPARGTIAVDIGDDVTRRKEVAATITARNGRIVVDRILRFGNDAERGLTLQTGVPEPQDAWVYPDGYVSDGTREEYAVYNPGDSLAEVSIDFVLDDPETNGVPESIDLSLPPGTHQLIDIGADGRVPKGVGHTGIVRSANGVPIVAERALYAEHDSRRGVTVTTGSPAESPRWTFAAGAVTENDDEYLVLVNLDAQILADVDVTAIVGGQEVPVSELQGIELGAGERRAIRIGEHINNRPDLTLVVSSSEPVVAERGLYRVGADQRGMSNAVGVPSAEGMRPPADPFAAPAAEDVPATTAPGDGSESPTAPGDVQLPAPDQTIIIENPDAETEDPSASSTTAAP